MVGCSRAKKYLKVRRSTIDLVDDDRWNVCLAPARRSLQLEIRTEGRFILCCGAELRRGGNPNWYYQHRRALLCTVLDR